MRLRLRGRGLPLRTHRRLRRARHAGQVRQVGILEVGPKRAPNILVLNPGTSASAAYFAPLARDVARKAKGCQVWAIERRENLLEDHSVFDRASGAPPRRARCSTTTWAGSRTRA